LSCCFTPFVIFCVRKPKVVKLIAQSFINFFLKWARFMPSHLDPCLLCCFPNLSQWFLVILLSCSPSLFFMCRNFEQQSSNFRILLFIDILFKRSKVHTTHLHTLTHVFYVVFLVFFCDSWSLCSCSPSSYHVQELGIAKLWGSVV
jgi:hypothetical protein